jgi:hypothetical protein
MCFVFIWEQTANFATYSINWLVFITQMESVYCAVRTRSLNKAVCASSVKGCSRPQPHPSTFLPFECCLLLGQLPQFRRIVLPFRCTLKTEWFQASATAKRMRTALFWVITQRLVVIYYRHFGTTYRLTTGTDRSSRNVDTKLQIFVWPCIMDTNNIDNQLDAKITVINNSNQLDMFRATISPIFRSIRLCLQLVV